MPYRGRVAYPSYVDESLFGNPHERTVRQMRGRPDAAADVMVLSGNEFAHINLRANTTGNEKSAKQLERERLHALSDARKAKWPNTLEAARERKERARQEKLDAEETMRQAIDREEEALQAEKRRLAIERANKMLYDSTDRVKALHSKLLLTDVLQERERQMELKSSITQRARVDEERWYQKQQEAIRRMDAEEDAREAEDGARRAELARVRREQIDARVQAHQGRMAERAADAETMRQIAQADLEAEKEHRLQELEKAHQMKAEFNEANRFLMKQREHEAAILAGEEQRMLQYAKQKERDLMERRDRETQRFVDRQNWRQKLIDTQIAKLTDINAQQNSRLEAQAVEVQAKAMEARNKLDEKKKDEMLVTHMSRQQQMRWKAEKAAQQEADDGYFADGLKKLNAQLREEEAQTIRDKFEECRRNDAFLLKQMSQKRDKVEDEKADDLMQAEMSKQWMADDDAIYEQYAQLCLDEYVAAGKSHESLRHPPLPPCRSLRRR